MLGLGLGLRLEVLKVLASCDFDVWARGVEVVFFAAFVAFGRCALVRAAADCDCEVCERVVERVTRREAVAVIAEAQYLRSTEIQMCSGLLCFFMC